MGVAAAELGDVEIGFVGDNSPVLVNVSGAPLVFDGVHNPYPLLPISAVPVVNRTVRLRIDRQGQEHLFLDLEGDSDSRHLLEVIQRDVEARTSFMDGNPVLLVGTLEMAKAYPGLVVAPILYEHWEDDPELMERPLYYANRFLTYGEGYGPVEGRWSWDYTLQKVEPADGYETVSI